MYVYVYTDGSEPKPPRGITRGKLATGKKKDAFHLHVYMHHPPPSYSSPPSFSLLQQSTGIIGGGLGIYGIVTAANNMKKAELNSPDRSFVWKSTGR